MGYLKEAIAINARYKRQKPAWAEHINKCHQHIIYITEKMPKGSKLMFLGSGGLKDIPVSMLLGMGYKLQFVDIIHFPYILKRYKNHPDVTFIEHDVTEFTGKFYKGEVTAPPHPSHDLFDIFKPDMIISINILSQLAIHFQEYADENKILLDDDFTADLLKAHIIWLQESKIKSIIISDIERHYKDSSKNIQIEDAIPKKLLPAPFIIWEWHIAPKGEIDNQTDLTHIVGLWKIGTN
jgi:hypothetical protein